MERIALFGPPGSGKTTLAKKIAEQTGYNIIEASHAVVFPLSQQLFRLPTEKILLKKLLQLSKKKTPAVTREQARHTFSELKKNYSPHFIARALHTLYVDNKKQDVIFSGLRGLSNAEYCRLHNDFVIYIKTNTAELTQRLCKTRGYTQEQARRELAEEERLFSTSTIENVANLVIDTTRQTLAQSTKKIFSALNNWNTMCKRCVNTARNPAITFDKKGYCSICQAYKRNFNRKQLKKELSFLHTFKNSGNNKHDILVGFSGGKDSTATLHTIKQMGFSPLAVTFDLGYLPATTISRAKKIAKLLDTDHEVIDLRTYIRKKDLAAYKKTLELYEQPFTLNTKRLFQKKYALGRKHYSIKCKHSLAFVRTCQLCRRMVIRAYYAEARKRGISAFVLGINEWTNLSASQQNKTCSISGIRKLQPHKNKKPVSIFHLPFLLQRTSKETKKILDRIGWKPPPGEDLIESNSNSCLFARSTERMAKQLLEFHPDSTRLAREVTVGFITKKQALKALKKLHPYKYTPRQVLQRAGIL